MSSLSDLLLRATVDPNYQTKGATLTYAELDANFQLLADVIRENLLGIAPAGIDPYSAGVEYANGDLVTYDGNLWEYTNVTPSTGNTPALGSTYWTLQSSGVLSHAQNTDTHTTNNRYGVGDSTATGNKEVFARTGAALNSEPRLRYNVTTNKWQYSDNGSTFVNFVTEAERTVWNAKQDALGYTPENISNKAQPNGYASLDGSGKVPSAQLPAYVDDVLEYANFAALPATGAGGVIYITIDNNLSYRWTGSTYVLITSTPSNASTTVAGIVEKSTLSELQAGTSVGGTGALLFVGPDDAKTYVEAFVYQNVYLSET